MDVYGHLMKETHNEAAEKLASLLLEPTKNAPGERSGSNLVPIQGDPGRKQFAAH